MRSAAAALVFVTGCACEHGVTGDALPIAIDMTTGPVLATIVEGDTERQAVIDLMAPFTVVDVPADTAPSRRCTDLTLRDAAGVARAHFDLTLTALNACLDEDGNEIVCQVGDDGATTPIDAIVGGDAFAPGAVRVDFVADTLTIFPDIAGDGAARGRLCEAQIPDPFRGGGTLSIGGSEVEFAARRIAIGACLAFDPEQDPDLVTDAGADVQLVVSTGIGPTILSQSAFGRYLDATGETLTLTPATVWLPWGPVTGEATTISRMALVGGYDDQRGPCRQVYAHHLLTARDNGCADNDDCPCPDARVCRVPAIVELSPPARLPVLIIPDDDLLLQSLRTELRPRTAEVDGILGTSALAPTSIDVDPPNNRVLIRCEATGCVVRPELITSDLEGLVADCLELAASL